MCCAAPRDRGDEGNHGHADRAVGDAVRRRLRQAGPVPDTDRRPHALRRRFTARTSSRSSRPTSIPPPSSTSPQSMSSSPVTPSTTRSTPMLGLSTPRSGRTGSRPSTSWRSSTPDDRRRPPQARRRRLRGRPHDRPDTLLHPDFAAAYEVARLPTTWSPQCGEVSGPRQPVDPAVLGVERHQQSQWSLLAGKFD